MSSPQSLFHASLNRLVFHLGSCITQTTANINTLIQEGPEKVCQTCELFIEEVQLEADRIEMDRENANTFNDNSIELNQEYVTESIVYSLDIAQDQVDKLRVQISNLLNQVGP